MSIEDRIRYLTRAASRAEGEGDERVARALLRMVEEAVAPVASLQLPSIHPRLGWRAE